uniref:Uncharacterized protein n=1 Tax=Parascaris univalens TaxID=6257 RepID=A0A915A5D8_PARUN
MRPFRKRCKVDEDGVIELSDEVRRQIKREEKRAKKEARRAEKERRREKKERERLAAEEASALVAKEEGGDKGSWKEQRKLVDTMPHNDEDIYGSNEHFNFGKPKKELPALPTHNPRPDFEKADWRDIEMWKAIREKEKQEKGDAQSTWKEEEHYLPSRFRRD